jgi:hypothetical protein
MTILLSLCTYSRGRKSLELTYHNKKTTNGSKQIGYGVQPRITTNSNLYINRHKQLWTLSLKNAQFPGSKNRVNGDNFIGEFLTWMVYGVAFFYTAMESVELFRFSTRAIW